MDIFSSIPYLIRILVSLGGILLIQKITKSLAIALAAGIVILGFWMGHSPASFVDVVSRRLFSLETLFLSIVIAGVIWLSSLMSEAGMMKDLVKSLKSRLSRKNLLAVLPAVVGLLPMPAGAAFSAPLLDDADEGQTLSALSKTRINYWFRHIWDFWWPLYPGVLLATALTGLEIWKLMILMIPVGFMTSVAGYIFLLRTVPREKAPRSASEMAFLPLVLPTMTVIGVYGLLLVLVPALSGINRYLPLVIGIVCGITVLQLQRPASMVVWKKILLSRRTVSLVVIVVLARLYGGFIESQLPGGFLLMEAVRNELSTFGIPVLLLVIILPFVSGLTTGITVGFIGASFPVMLSLAGPDTGGLFAAIAISYTCGYIGMMLSPIHVCYIVTVEYYKTNLYESSKGLILPALFSFAFAMVYAFILSLFTGA